MTSPASGGGVQGATSRTSVSIWVLVARSHAASIGDVTRMLHARGHLHAEAIKESITTPLVGART